MKLVAFHTLGCKVNQYETEAMTEQFLAAGYKVVDFEDVADIYVINTCTVTNIADKKSRKMLSKAKKRNEDAVVVAVGCYVQVAHDQLEEVPYVDVLVGNTHKNEIVKVVEDYTWTHTRADLIENVHKDVVFEELFIDSQLNKTRSTIKIQDGCNQYCTYCIIPYTRGVIRSRKPESVIKEVKRLADNGFKEIILTGIHLGSYGKDLKLPGKDVDSVGKGFASDGNDSVSTGRDLGGVKLIDLIEDLDKIEGIERIRLGSLEPNFITDDLLERLVKCDSVCPHFHLSMQSGSDSVLERMRRRYRSKEYLEKVELIREYYDRPAITTDVIVGFPMETEGEEQETYDFVGKVGFSDLHVFKYSIRKGTKAADMKPQVDGKVKSERSKRLTELGNRLHVEYLESFKGESLEVLFEEVNDGYVTGHTKNYIKVYMPLDEVEKVLDAEAGTGGIGTESEICDEIHGRSLKVLVGEIFKDGLIGKLE